MNPLLAELAKLPPKSFSPRLRAALLESARRRGDSDALKSYCERLGFRPDPWQLELLAAREKRLCVTTGRQGGKSTITALRALRTAISGPARDVLLLAPTQRQSGEIFKKMLAFAKHPASGAPSIKRESALQVEFNNGSRVVALPGAEPHNVRGFSAIRAVIIDEGAFVPDEIFHAVSPMLAVSGGDLIAISTAWESKGWYYEACQPDSDWRKWVAPASENPRIDRHFLEQEQRSMGSDVYLAEYECRFLPAGKFSVFDPAAVERAQQDWTPLLDWGKYEQLF